MNVQGGTRQAHETLAAVLRWQHMHAINCPTEGVLQNTHGTPTQQHALCVPAAA
jgi:hypothetical protein